jgi:periplasmic protein TonB
MLNKYLNLAFLFVSISAFSQENLIVCYYPNSPIVRAARFKNGTEGLNSYIKNNIRYPKTAIRANVEGKVYVKFKIQKNGKIDSINVLKGIGFGCDEEAIRLIKSMPRWKPCIGYNKKRIPINHTLPILFTLPD